MTFAIRCRPAPGTHSRRVIALALVAACQSPRGADRTAPPESSPTDLETRIQRVERGLLRAVAIRDRPDAPLELAERMRRYGVPGVSIAVIDGYRIAWARGYGVTAAGGTQAVDTATLFQAGSISKPVTAMAALHFVERGELGLDEDVNRKLASWKVPESRFTREQKVTLRRLLTHSAGLTVPGFRGYATGIPLPTVAQVLAGTKPANSPPVVVDTFPGARWSYSGGGYTVVQQLLTDVSGIAFPDLMRRVVLGPVGMTHSTFEQQLPPALAVRTASGHQPGGTPLPGRSRVHPEMAAAGLWSTPSDLARWAIELQLSYRGRSNRVLSATMVQQMLTSQIGTWGLGPSLGGAGTSATFGHAGSTEGFTADLLAFPETGQGVVVMTNSGGGEPLIAEIIRSVTHEYGWQVPPRKEKTLAVVDTALYPALAGQYRIELGARGIDVAVTTDGSRLYFTGSSGKPAEILPESTLRYFSPESGTEFTFVRGIAGPASELIILQDGSRFNARRMR